MERRLRYDDFDVSSEPELALIKARAELIQRINVLEDSIRPFVAAKVSSTSAPPGRLLLDAGIIDKDMYATLGQALDATSPVAHGRSVSPSLASEVVSPDGVTRGRARSVALCSPATSQCSRCEPASSLSGPGDDNY